MTFALSLKSYSCWNCHHFQPVDRSQSVEGWCRKYAPTGRDLYGPCDACPGSTILTTKGDVLTHDGSDAVRLGVGTDGQVLTADSAETDGIKWATPSGGSPLTTKGDLYTYDTANQRLPVGTDGQVLSADSSESTGLKWIDAQEEYRYLQAENMDEVLNNTGYFTRHTVNQSNPSGLAITNGSTQYYNGVQAPWLLAHTWRVINIKVLVAAACVSTPAVGSAPTFRLDFFFINMSNRSTITNGTQRLPCVTNAVEIRANSSLTHANTFIYFAEDTFSGGYIETQESRLFGFEFVPESGSQDTINGFSRATAYVELLKIGSEAKSTLILKSDGDSFVGSINPNDITHDESFAKWCYIKVAPNEWCGEYKPAVVTVPDPPSFVYPEPTP